jgi:hypothetical protein
VKLLGSANQAVRNPALNYFPGVTGKILPATLAFLGIVGCQNASVSADTAVPLRVPVVAPAGSVLRVRLDQTLDTERNRPGDRFTGMLDTPLLADGKEVLPKGTIVDGHVLNARQSGRLKGRAVLSLTLDYCELNGSMIPLSANTVVRVSGRHRKRNWALMGGGSGAGALTGGLVAGPVGAAVGAGSGAAAGIVGAAVTGKKQVSMPAETAVGFTLKGPLTL